jgi:hypothetical protein
MGQGREMKGQGLGAAKIAKALGIGGRAFARLSIPPAAKNKWLRDNAVRTAAPIRLAETFGLNAIRRKRARWFGAVRCRDERRRWVAASF